MRRFRQLFIADSSMDIINQTNRTMLFEEINPEKLDLVTIVGDVRGIDSLSDDKIKEINQHLLDLPRISVEEWATRKAKAAAD